MRRTWFYGFALFLASCEFRMSGDQTRLDDLTQRIMKLEKKNDEAEANFKAVSQFANATNQRLDKIDGRQTTEQKP